MDSQDYLVVSVGPLSEENAEIFEAVVGDLGFDSFMQEEDCLRCYIQTDLFDEEIFRETIAGIPLFEGLSVDISKMEACNWNAVWEQEGFTPIDVDGEVTIAPAGTDVSTPLAIYLDPQMAFGTGHHHTTYMMMQTMLALKDVLKGKSVVDLGCGTAVLAILADKLGAGETLGIDIDAVAVRSSLENLRMNGCNFPLVCGDASALVPCDVLLANIHKNIIINDMARYAEAVRPGGKLLLSGFFETDAPAIVDAAASHGFVLEGRKVREDWCCLQLKHV